MYTADFTKELIFVMDMQEGLFRVAKNLKKTEMTKEEAEAA